MDYTNPMHAAAANGLPATGRWDPDASSGGGKDCCLSCAPLFPAEDAPEVKRYEKSAADWKPFPGEAPPTPKNCECLDDCTFCCGASRTRRCLSLFCCFFVFCFGEVFEYVVRRPTHALTYPERQWRLYDDVKTPVGWLLKTYRCLVRNIFFPLFRFVTLNVLFEVLAEDEANGLKHIQEVYTFIGLVEALLLAMIITVRHQVAPDPRLTR